MNDFAKEILAMNQVFGEEESASTDAPSTDAPTTDAPIEDGDLTTDAPGTEAPSTDAPTTESPNVEEELRRRIAELEAERKAPKTDAPTTNAPTTEAPFTNEDFLGEMDLDDLTRDPEKFNELLNNVLKKGMEMAKGLTTKESENVLKSIPDIVKNNLTLVTNLTKAREKFYEENADLKPWGKVVAAVFEEVAAKNPDKTITENLSIVGDEVRKRLNLKKDAIKANKNSGPPKLPRNKGNKRTQTKPQTSGLVAEIDAMNKSI
jgi:hypothetical protein